MSEQPQDEQSQGDLNPGEQVAQDPAAATQGRAAEVTMAEKARNPDEDRFECRSCGYVYEPLKGDDRRSIPPNTAFRSLDTEWRCPVCTAPKMQFKNVGPKGKASGFEENLGYGLGVNVMTPGQKNVLIFGSLGLAFLFFLSLYGLG